MCQDFVNNNCGRDWCKFSHDIKRAGTDSGRAIGGIPDAKPCYDFLFGGCKRHECRFSHDMKRAKMKTTGLGPKEVGELEGVSRDDQPASSHQMRAGEEENGTQSSDSTQEAERRRIHRDSNNETEIEIRRRGDEPFTLETCQDFQSGGCEKETPCRLIHCSPQGTGGEGDATVEPTDQNHSPQSADENEEDPTGSGRQVNFTNQSGSGKGGAKRREAPSLIHTGQGDEKNGRMADMKAEQGSESRTGEIQIIRCRPKLRHSGQSTQ